MNQYLICEHCQSRVSRLLALSKRTYNELVYLATDEKPLLLDGTYCFDIDSNIVVSISDKFHIDYHSDKNRFAGCCGASTEGLPNLLCGQCREALGREITDCLTPHYIRFEAHKVSLKDTYSTYISLFEEKGLNEKQQSEIEMLIKYGQLTTLQEVFEYINVK